MFLGACVPRAWDCVLGFPTNGGREAGTMGWGRGYTARERSGAVRPRFVGKPIKKDQNAPFSRKKNQNVPGVNKVYLRQ